MTTLSDKACNTIVETEFCNLILLIVCKNTVTPIRVGSKVIQKMKNTPKKAEPNPSKIHNRMSAINALIKSVNSVNRMIL